MPVIEVEQRADVPDNKIDAIRTFLAENAEQTRSFKRSTLVQIDQADFSVSDSGKFDLKIRNNELGALLFTVKEVNSFNPTTRLESQVELELDQLDELLTNMKLLGYNYWLLTTEQRETFEYKNAKIDIIDHHSIGRQVLEIEIPADSAEEVPAVEQQVHKMFSDFDLVAMDDDLLRSILTQLNQAKNYQFNLSKISVDIVTERFLEFIS